MLGEIAEVREIDETVNRLKGSEKSGTFHGRTCSPTARRSFASGVIDYAGVGPAYPYRKSQPSP